jgi:hypothetical protein
MKRILAAWLLVALPVAAQDINPAKSKKVDQVKVDAAIKKGVEFLKGKNSEHTNICHDHKSPKTNTELVLLTYVTADVPVTDPAAKELFDFMMKAKLEATYNVALQAMALEEIDRVKHQIRIAQCAQFLVDNQSSQGYWGYGEPTGAAESYTPTTSTAPVATQPKGARVYEDPGVSMGKIKPKVKGRIAIKKTRDGEQNDNSNSQYAALGMRACHDSGIIIPRDVTALAIKWIRGAQSNDSNAKAEPLDVDTKISGGPGPGSTVASNRVVAAPQGWCYQKDSESYGSMTAGSVGSLCIWLYINDNDEGRNKSWRRDKNVHEGLQWINKNYSVTENPIKGNEWYLYYMYALERVGMLFGTETIGAHEWYPDGAKVLLESQKDDGSWDGKVWDTCFAILFLKRATRPLVATHAAGGSR